MNMQIYSELITSLCRTFEGLSQETKGELELISDFQCFHAVLSFVVVENLFENRFLVFVKSFES